jgi:hypothetical protein
MANADMGLIGLAVIGENLALNIESKGYWRGRIVRPELPRKALDGRRRGGRVGRTIHHDTRRHHDGQS